MVTPFLRSINTEGGTLYTFPSASKDLTRTFVSNDYEFKFSHFACLNLPNFRSDDKNRQSKGIYLETFDYPINQWTPDSMRKGISEHFQNYIMNFETAILNGDGDNDDYDNDILTTVSEKVFFNWLQKVGAIEFDGNIESYESLSDRTVQYIGNIDVINTVEINGDFFDELYIHIPSTVGASPKVYFREGSETDNKNYLDKDYELGSNGESVIIGRDNTKSHPYGLSMKPIMDNDNGANMYIGDIGHTIDFRDSSYADGDGIYTMNENSSYDFKFNAVLIYYDFLEKTKTSGVKKLATNLYGILFLDDVEDMTSVSSETNKEEGYFQRYHKEKETIYGNGNSFALKIDLKVDTTPDVDSARIEIKDPNDVVAMSLYEKSLVQLQKCIDLFYEQRNEISKLKERVNTLETLLSNIDEVDDLKGEITRLYDLYEGTTSVDNNSILSLIEVNSKKLDTIMNGGKDIKLQYDTDVLQAGAGVTLDKSLNKVVINASQGYAINKFYTDGTFLSEITDVIPLDPSESTADCYLKLKSGENIAVLYIDDAGEYSTSIDIYIKTDEINWNVGQSLKIYLKASGEDKTLNLEDSYGINIYNGGEETSYKIYNDELEGIRVIEIICTGENEYIYLLTK